MYVPFYRQVFHLKVLKQTKYNDQTLITVSLICSPVCSSAVIGCTYDIPSGIYNMYVYDIEEEDTLSDEWAISSTNITITGLEPTYSSLDVICPVSPCPVSMVTVTTGTCDHLTSK